MKYEKLVRDFIPEIIEAEGKQAITRVLENEEMHEALKEKLLEEAQEYIESEDPDELADLLEVIMALLDYHETTFEGIEQVRTQKLNERGGFNEKIFLEEVIE